MPSLLPGTPQQGGELGAIQPLSQALHCTAVNSVPLKRQLVKPAAAASRPSTANVKTILLNQQAYKLKEAKAASSHFKLIRLKH